MATTHKLIGLNIVLVSNNINTSLFTQYWFIKKGIIQEKDFLPDSVFIPGFTNVSTIDYQLTVLPDKIQFSLKNDNVEISERCIREVMVGFVEAMDGVSINAVGQNFIWRVEDAERSVHQLGKSLFSKDNEIGIAFVDDNARYGAYYSKDYDENIRLKLDIKPVNSMENGDIVEYLLASFNYHSDVTSDKLKEFLLSQLSKWTALLCHSKEVICLLR